MQTLIAFMDIKHVYKSNFKKSVVIITAIFSGSVFADVNIGDFNTGVIGNGTAVGNNNSLGGSTMVSLLATVAVYPTR